MCQQAVLVYVITTSFSATYSVAFLLHQCLHCFKVCQQCLTIEVVQAFGGIFKAVFAGFVSGVTGNLLFKS